MSSKKPLQKLVLIAISLSTLFFLFLIWFIYFRTINTKTEFLFISQLPLLNAILNSLSAICLVLAVVFIKKHQILKHQLFINCSILFSAMFLVSYLFYHYFQGHVVFTGQGFVRSIYFFILITHIVGSAVMLPLIIITYILGWSNNLLWHKRMAKYTFPLWFYVSVTGVVIYFFVKYLS